MNYLQVQFFSSKPDGSSIYMYKTTKTCLSPGDFVVVPVNATGKTVVRVHSINQPQPHFECKKVIKKVRL